MSKYDELNKAPTLIPTGHSIPGFRMRTHLLSSLIEEIITERRMQFRARTDIQIESNLGPASYGLFATIDPVEFKNALTNLIINSVEASNHGGQISVEMQSTAGGFIEITVTDKGCGIPEEILPRLMRKGASFGKSNGHGIGLYHARKAIESWNGTIRIDSTPDKGTRVFILLPKAEPPEWFVPELKVTPNTEVVVIDDDPSIHEVWKERLNGIRLHHFQSPDSVIAWHQARADTTAAESLWLVDYEFIGNSKNGLELIELLGVQQRSVLVTSHFDDRDVLEGCKRSSVRMLPKTLAGWVGVRGMPVSDT
jgi:anti-sigma regulatory factor (Ser/Thr protein kinase)